MGKESFLLNEEEWKPAIRSFIKKLVVFESCYNKKREFFTKCSRLKKLNIIDHAVDHLSIIGMMNENNQDAFFKELLNNRKHRST
jgi:hypothetical protein